MSLMWRDSGFTLPPEAKEEALRVYEEGYFVPHRNNPLWQSCCLHGATWYETNTPDQYGKTDQSDYHWTELTEICPSLTKFFKEEFIFETYQRVRFMLLLPGGEIPEHDDAGDNEERRERAKTEFCEGALNAAITQPEGAFLRDAETGVDIPYQEGSIFWINVWRKHYGRNDSNEPRIHMIIHGKKRRGS